VAKKTSAIVAMQRELQRAACLARTAVAIALHQHWQAVATRTACPLWATPRDRDTLPPPWAARAIVDARQPDHGHRRPEQLGG